MVLSHHPWMYTSPQRRGRDWHEFSVFCEMCLLSSKILTILFFPFLLSPLFLYDSFFSLFSPLLCSSPPRSPHSSPFLLSLVLGIESMNARLVLVTEQHLQITLDFFKETLALLNQEIETGKDLSKTTQLECSRVCQFHISH